MSYDPSPAAPTGRRDLLERRRVIRDLLGLIFSLVSLAAFVWWALHQQKPQLPSSAEDIALLVLAILLYGVATVVRGWRWHRILKRAEVDHKRSDAFALTAVGYMGNTILPARGGEILRILLLGERSSSPRREILGTIVAERLLDAVVLVLLFVALTWSGVSGTQKGRFEAAIGLGVIVASAIGLVVYVQFRKRGRLERFAATIRPFVRSSRLLYGRLGLALLALTAGVWLLEGVIFWLIGESLGLDLNVLEGTFLTVLTSFFLLIPAAPGYIGTFDAALAIGLHAVDVTGGQALAFVLLTRFVLFVPVTLAGLLLMFTRYGGVRWFASRWRRRSNSGRESPQSSASASSGSTTIASGASPKRMLGKPSTLTKKRSEEDLHAQPDQGRTK